MIGLDIVNQVENTQQVALVDVPSTLKVVGKHQVKYEQFLQSRFFNLPRVTMLSSLIA